MEEDEKTLLKEFLEADKDPGNLEVKANFTDFEVEDFTGIEDFQHKASSSKSSIG